MAIDFENNTITTTNTTGNISLYPETPTSRWAILLPNEDSVTVNVNAVGYIEKNITIPPVKKNDFLHGENAVSFELTAMEAGNPLTMFALEPATIHVINPPDGMKYSIIMSLVDEENFATITTMEGASFAGFFAGNDYPGGTFIINASGLLLPATELVDRCYASMFYQCGTLEKVTCLATTITSSNCTTNWLYEVNNPGTFTKAKGASCWTWGSDGIPFGWTVNEY